MSLPVLDTFAEHGFSIFQSPEATFADFFAAGIFRRAGIDVEAGAPRLTQREALLDVALYHGLSSIIGSYVLALDKKKEFVLNEPVAVQTWAAKHVTELAATATTALDQLFVGGKPNMDLGAHLRSLRGLRHVLKALTDRLELAAGPLAVPEAAALTQEARSYLDQLLRTLHDTTLRLSFGQWLVDESALHKVHYDAAGLSRRFHTQAPLVLAAICDAAQVAPLSPPPSTGLALWQTLYTPTATSLEVSSAILLFMGLEMLASCAKPKAAPQPLATLQATTRRLATALGLNDIWSRSILGLWCLQYNVHASEAATLLQPSHLLDRSILLALVHVLLRHQQPSLAWQLWSTTPASEDDVDLLLELHLAMHDVEGAWRLLRAFPRQNAARLPQLLTWHVANDSLRHWVLALHWSPTELPLVHAFLLADDRHHELLVRLYLGRSDYDQAYALAHALPSVANHAALQALLKATQLNQTAGDVLPTHLRALADTSDAAAYAPGLYSGKRSTATVKVTATARTLNLDEPVTPPPVVVVSAGPKPRKERYYAAFGWSTTPQKGASLENRNALVVGPSLAASPAGPAADLMTSTHQVLRYNFVEPSTTVSAPRILRTPQSSSKAGKARRGADEPLHAPAARDLFTTPDRSTQPREANSTPSLRRNPVRSVRMHT
ncbi:hypothetical protein SDRG_03733 [Saprolegnia diclina VS20]|uniref:ELYS-like domain-containing protein n=1 Tax=Saprolegnia diclina (strain VS20) TaxID=1156394 RepID=T0QL26_SAPDV|nr:hypothetical protein SDRG_03733 [Saprolegnia diclina VS20]EQC38774.1 hypothetical protein SDRG_03733 [Saprolegnia diclina VS20]|eukprot:XP_008607598.1 hypothetical protein SDRG_03733 [Saprolegnia diclina VS20]